MRCLIPVSLRWTPSPRINCRRHLWQHLIHLQLQRQHILVFIYDTLSLNCWYQIVFVGSSAVAQQQRYLVIGKCCCRSLQEIPFSANNFQLSHYISHSTRLEGPNLALTRQFGMYFEVPFVFFCARDTTWHERFLYISALILDMCEFPMIRTSTWFGVLTRLVGCLAEVITGYSGSRWLRVRQGFLSSLVAEHT